MLRTRKLYEQKTKLCKVIFQNKRKPGQRARICKYRISYGSGSTICNHQFWIRMSHIFIKYLTFFLKFFESSKKTSGSGCFLRIRIPGGQLITDLPDPEHCTLSVGMRLMYLRDGYATFPGKLLLGLLAGVGVGQVRVEVLVEDL
jgi:hypothetical protein